LPESFCRPLSLTHASTFCCNFSSEIGWFQDKSVRAKADQPSPDLTQISYLQAQNNAAVGLGFDTLAWMPGAFPDIRGLLL
jgi:hypothetical protein